MPSISAGPPAPAAPPAPAGPPAPATLTPTDPPSKQNLDKDAELKKHLEAFKAELNNQIPSKTAPDIPDRPLEKWFNSADVLRMQAELQKENGHKRNYWILVMRFIELGRKEPVVNTCLCDCGSVCSFFRLCFC